jgi:hypothetical protein
MALAFGTTLEKHRRQRSARARRCNEHFARDRAGPRRLLHFAPERFTIALFNMQEPTNGQSPPPQNGQLLAPPKPKAGKYTGEILLRTRPRIYRQVARLISEGVSANKIERLCRVSHHVITAVQQRESVSIAERKKQIIANLSDVAELGSERMSEKIGKASLRDAAIGTGIAVDKMLALSGQTPVGVGVVFMPSEAERENMRTLDARLDAIAKRLSMTPAANPLTLPPSE